MKISHSGFPQFWLGRSSGAVLVTLLLACRPGAEAEDVSQKAAGASVKSAVHSETLAGGDQIPPPKEDAPSSKKSNLAEGSGKQKKVKQNGSGGSVTQKVTQQANRLALQTSPYLLMHAHNPVDWYPWGEEALKRARRENKLIFISIGYSSCYWCHVMERETFMDKRIAQVMNKNFVCIKVDREERPDVDEVYMTSLQIYFRSIGSPQGGGWPLSMFLTPTGDPFFGGTYFPPYSERGRTGFSEVLQKVLRLWKTKPDDVKKMGARLAQLVSQTLDGNEVDTGVRQLDAEVIDQVLQALAGQYDKTYGGFGFSEQNARIPKFPQPSNLMFLVDRVRRTPGGIAEAMLMGTLDHMAQGGVRDQLGGGFHRYSTDRFWRVPHFEKMLYDNGQLISLYAMVYALQKNDRKRAAFRRVIEEASDFVLREMTDPEGGFYTALDAETDAEEGKFYVWTTQELRETLPPAEFQLFSAVYGVDDGSNFEGRHVLELSHPLAQTAGELGLSETELLEQLEPIRRRLLAIRSKRKRPLTDTKILTSWNGLMIRGLADAGHALQKQAYTDAAVRAADFVLNKLRTPDGRLLRTYRQGEAKLNAYLNDYAFLTEGLLRLWQTTGDRKWLESADALMAKQIELFWDEESGGFFDTSHDHEKLIARGKNIADNALPAGNSVATDNLIKLAAAMNKPKYLDLAKKTLQMTLPRLQQVPITAPRMAAVLAAYLDVQERSSARTPAAVD